MSRLRSVSELVVRSLDDVKPLLETFAGREDEPSMLGYAKYGVPWFGGACRDEAGLSDVAEYRESVSAATGSAWMDNTTLVTASRLMSDGGSDLMTPLTVWDLATFARAVVCYERIFHHEHPDVSDGQINALLGASVLTSVPLPIRPVPAGRVLPDPWHGAHQLMCDIWMDAQRWLRRLHDSAEHDTLDGQQLRAVSAAWRAALGRDDIQPRDLVNYVGVDRRWRSPSNRLLRDTVNITTVDDTRIYLDPMGGFQALADRRRELGLPDTATKRRGELLSDLNLRAYVNQRIADFFELPYACSAGRLPFRQHLYDRSSKVQQALTTAQLIDDRYAELAQSVQLRLPVFLAVTLRDCVEPQEIWSRLARIRSHAAVFRAHRGEIDAALARGDLKEARKVAKALNLSVEGLLEVAGKATVAAGSVVLEAVSRGDIDVVRHGISAVKAASSPVLKSSFAERLVWRLRKPQLLWINNLVDQSQRLTEAMPDFSRVWRLPANRQSVFVERFARMAELSGRSRT